MTDQITIGIDPGKSGAIAAMSLSGEPEGVWGYPGDPASLWGLASDIHMRFAVKLACLEQVHSFPGQGVSSSFNFGVNYGVWQGIMVALNWPTLLVTPARWRKPVFDSAMPAKPRKRDIKAWALRRWPTAEIGRADHAEALCMAEYARLQLVGK